VTKIAPDGSSTTYTGTGSDPDGIAFDGTNMWTANYDGNSVTKIAPDGTMTTYTGTGSYPAGIAFDGTNMWVANEYGNSVTKIAPDGTMTTYTGTGPYPYAIAFDGTNMWTADWSANDKVTEIAPDGTMTTYAGTGADPIAIAFDGINMWTANYNGSSVTKIAAVIPAADEISSAKAALAAASPLQPVAGVDSNVVAMAQNIINASSTGVTISATVDSSNANVASDGTITYSSSTVSGDVTLTLTDKSDTDTQTVSVAVPELVIQSGLTFTTVQDGDWTDGATWGKNSPGIGGVDYPGADDNVIINNNVTPLSADASPNDVTINGGGTLNLNGHTLNVSGDLANSGTFTADSGTVNLTGSGQTISGNNTFYNLTKTTASADTLYFTDGTQTVTGTLSLNGATGNLLTLKVSPKIPPQFSLKWGEEKTAGGFLYPDGVAVDASSSDIFVADTANNRIVKMDSSR